MDEMTQYNIRGVSFDQFVAFLFRSTAHMSTALILIVVAALIFLVAAYLLLGFVIHLVSFLFSTLLFVVAVVAVIWALRVLL